jgi:hypothetical protein
MQALDKVNKILRFTKKLYPRLPLASIISEDGYFRPVVHFGGRAPPTIIGMQLFRQHRIRPGSSEIGRCSSKRTMFRTTEA